MNEFDMKYLKGLFDDLNESYKEQSKSLSMLERTASVMNVTLESIKKRNEEQDEILKRHSGQIRMLERFQDSNDVSNQLKGVWHHIKRFNAYMDLARKDTDIDTKSIDTHAQRIQHAAELSMSQQNMMKDIFTKVAPWLLIGLIVGAGLLGAVGYQWLQGKIVVQSVPTVQAKE